MDGFKVLGVLSVVDHPGANPAEKGGKMRAINTLGEISLRDEIRDLGIDQRVADKIIDIFRMHLKDHLQYVDEGGMMVNGILG